MFIKGFLDIGYQVKVHYGCYNYYLLVLKTEDSALLTSEVAVLYNCLINISQARDFFLKHKETMHDQSWATLPEPGTVMRLAETAT